METCKNECLRSSQPKKTRGALYRVSTSVIFQGLHAQKCKNSSLEFCPHFFVKVVLQWKSRLLVHKSIFRFVVNRSIHRIRGKRPALPQSADNATQRNCPDDTEDITKILDCLLRDYDLRLRPDFGSKGPGSPYGRIRWQLVYIQECKSDSVLCDCKSDSDKSDSDSYVTNRSFLNVWLLAYLIKSSADSVGKKELH